MEARQYESTYIITPELETEAYNQIVEKFNNLLASAGASIVNQEVWGFKKLAYEIRRKQTGYFVYTEFRATPELVEKLEREYAYEERIMRYLTVGLNGDAIVYNLRRRAKLSGELPADQPVVQPAEAVTSVE